MDKDTLNKLSTSEFQKKITDFSTEQCATVAPHLDNEKLTLLMTWIHDQYTNGWKEMVLGVMGALEKKTQLEVIGKTLSAKQFSELMDLYPNHLVSKLPPIIAGMPQNRFIELVQKSSDHQMELLKHEGITEPVQHHLTVLTHSLGSDNTALIQSLSQLEADINELDLKALSKQLITDLETRISESENECLKALVLISKVQTIAWNGQRIDTIDKLNTLHISYIRLIKTTEELQALLKQRLFSIYGDPKDPESAQDDEPAVEGLVKLSVWYLQDYLDIGLLPETKSIENISQDERERLFKTVQENLKKLGLNTVKDLKELSIFSRQALEEYIQSHKDFFV